MNPNLKNKYKVSILVPVYGVEKYIEKCAHSLFTQTFKNIEFIFVDDCTQDSSIFILEKVLSLYPDRIQSTKIIKHEQNSGVGASRSTAINAASGEYIIFVDSDDYIELDMIELMYDKAVEISADIVFCQIINEYANGKSCIFSDISFKNKIEYVNSSFSQPSLCNKLLKREIIQTHDLKLVAGINYGEDLSFTPKMIYYSNVFGAIEKPLYHYVQYNLNSYTREFSDENLSQTFIVIEMLNGFFEKKSDSYLYKESLLLLKAIRKAKVLRSGRVELKYINLFPEINSHINNMKLDVKTKLILWLAAINQIFFLRLFVQFLLKRKQLKEE